MMHPAEEHLHDFVDGALSSEEEARVEVHLADCSLCAGTVVAIRGLRRAARELGAREPAAPNLWPRIEAGIRRSSRLPSDDLTHSRRVHPDPRAPSGWWGRLPGKAAAVLLLAAASSGTAYLMVRGPGGDFREPGTQHIPAVEEGVTAHFASSPSEEVEAAYEPTIRELRQLLDEGRDRLQPETLEVLEEAMRVIDEALREAGEALDADPANPWARRSLTGVYEKKVQLLVLAARLAPGT